VKKMAAPSMNHSRRRKSDVALVHSAQLFELMTLLTRPAIDLNRVSKALDSVPWLKPIIIRLANADCPQYDRRITRISDAVILLGVEFVRKVLVTFTLLEFCRLQLPAADLGSSAGLRHGIRSVK
jgi:HD-like signal output (HDOD) protein